MLTYFDGFVVNDNAYHTYVVPIYTKVSGNVSQFRLFPALLLENQGGDNVDRSFGSFAIDWIRVVRAPQIHKVEGCIDKYFPNNNFLVGMEPREHREAKRSDGYYLRRGLGVGNKNVSTEIYSVNANRHNVTRTYFHRIENMPFGQTYNCPRSGGITILIQGTDFGEYSEQQRDGGLHGMVTVAGHACEDVEIVEKQSLLRCTLPATLYSENLERLAVRVAHLDLPPVFDEKDFLSYAVPPTRLAFPPRVSNVKAHALTLSWQPPQYVEDALTTTGYVIYQRAEGTTVEYDEVAKLGNVTSTEVIGLEANSLYSFRVAAVAEDQRENWQNVDLYGRRDLLASALVGAWSDPCDPVATLGEDILLKSIDANATQNRGAIDTRTSLSPLAQPGGEGHFGLTLVGAASIENCNQTNSCCDRDGVTCCFHRLNAATNLTSMSGSNTSFEHPNGIMIMSQFTSPIFNRTCGPSLRITGAQPRTKGAAWYSRQQDVRVSLQ